MGINFAGYDQIPVEVRYPANYPEEDQVTPVSLFTEMDIHNSLLSNIAKCSYHTATPIQKYAIPLVLCGLDILAAAQTGSGKTAAFLIPTINHILCNPFPPSFNKATPRALILAPTRELALQIWNESQALLFQTRLRSVVLYGGSSRGQQLGELKRGCDVCVATPGRLIDLLETTNLLILSQIRILILDEADRMLDQGFKPQILRILKHMPDKDGRQALLFSATMPNAVQELAEETLTSHHVFVAVGRVGGTTENITHRVMWVDEANKFSKLEALLDTPEMSSERVLVFVARKHRADTLVRTLNRIKNIQAGSIHGNHSQNQRERVLESFRSGQLRVLVATDVAARGLDLPAVGFVIQVDAGNSIDDYVHRMGRTGRIGNKGVGISFVNSEVSHDLLKPLHALLLETHQHVPDELVKAIQPSGGGGGGGGGKGKNKKKKSNPFNNGQANGNMEPPKMVKGKKKPFNKPRGKNNATKPSENQKG